MSLESLPVLEALFDKVEKCFAGYLTRRICAKQFG
jgi:hypothetical protein